MLSPFALLESLSPLRPDFFDRIHEYPKTLGKHWRSNLISLILLYLLRKALWEIDGKNIIFIKIYNSLKSLVNQEMRTMKVKHVYCCNCEQETGEMDVKKWNDNEFSYTFHCKNCGHTAEGEGAIDEDQVEESKNPQDDGSVKECS